MIFQLGEVALLCNITRKLLRGGGGAPRSPCSAAHALPPQAPAGLKGGREGTASGSWDTEPWNATQFRGLSHGNEG